MRSWQALFSQTGASQILLAMVGFRVVDAWGPQPSAQGSGLEFRVVGRLGDPMSQKALGHPVGPAFLCFALAGAQQT